MVERNSINMEDGGVNACDVEEHIELQMEWRLNKEEVRRNGFWIDQH